MLPLPYRNAIRRWPDSDRRSAAMMSSVPTVAAHGRLTSPERPTQCFGLDLLNGITDAPSIRANISISNSFTSRESSS